MKLFKFQEALEFMNQHFLSYVGDSMFLNQNPSQNSRGISWYLIWVWISLIEQRSTSQLFPIWFGTKMRLGKWIFREWSYIIFSYQKRRLTSLWITRRTFQNYLSSSTIGWGNTMATFGSFSIKKSIQEIYLKWIRRNLISI